MSTWHFTKIRPPCNSMNFRQRVSPRPVPSDGSTPGPASATSPSGCNARGYDLQLTRYDERGWRATFYTTGMEHSPTSAKGTGWERTPWHATQRAAWEALKRLRGS